MGVHDGHRQRLRARFEQNGLEGFEEHEALELLLFYAIPRQNTNSIAHALIDRFGSFANVLDAPAEELEKVKGIGKNSAALIKLMPQVSAYYLAGRAAPGQMLNTTEKAGEFFMPKFVGRQKETVYMAALDDKRKVLRCVRISDEGINNAVRISIKRIVTEAINTNATGVVLAHNHPGGIALPSVDDKRVTQKAHNALRLVNVQLLDHIIVADEDFVSMADSGFMEMYNSFDED